jgi:hypothetical protein
MFKSILVSWLTDLIFGKPTTLDKAARRVVNRRITAYKPRNYARRAVRSALRKLL